MEDLQKKKDLIHNTNILSHKLWEILKTLPQTCLIMKFN